MRKLLLIQIFSLLYSVGAAQPVLQPSIGVGTLPNDNDSVCNISWYLGSFYTSGLQAGDTAYNFTLYDLNGDSLNLSDALSNGKPVLLIAGSYTCPVYRNKVSVINDLVTAYTGIIDVYIIYTLEAHPDIDTSVYFGYVNPGTQNTQAGILYRQPQTYGERKTVVTDMLASMTTLAPVFLDGPCNNWWNAYGPAPNNAYLIDTNGVVFSKHGWFNKHPDNIYCDIDSLTGFNSGNCSGSSGFSNFTFQLTSPNTIYDIPGSTISVDAEITNNGTQDILVHAQRLVNDLPAGWGSSMCIDVCYSTTTDSAVFLLPAGTTQPVYVYFYTSAGIDSGYVKLGFRNLSNTSNTSMMHAFGITTSAVGIVADPEQNDQINIFPNPTASEITISADLYSSLDVQVFNTVGKLMLQSTGQKVIDVTKLDPGVYFIKIDSVVKKFVKK